MPRSAVIFVADRLGAAYVGPYGNTWLPTPSFDALAAESLLVEFTLADSPELAAVYRSYWSGMHAAAPGEIDPEASLAARLTAKGLETMLVTDERSLITHPLAQGFARLHRVEAEDEAPAAGDVEQTQLASLVYTAIDRLEEMRSPFLMWIHARALAGPWDAPYDLREKLAAEEDPPPPRSTVPPSRIVAADHDPDELLGWTQAYGGQVMLLDMALSALTGALAELPHAGETLLAVTSPRGYPLGEHGLVGGAEGAGRLLYGESLQVPLLLRFPDRLAATLRVPGITQPPDLFATLLEWHGVDSAQGVWGRSVLPAARDDAPLMPPAALSVAHGERALRTSGWFWRAASDGSAAELFVKPDDRVEVNDISTRCPEEAEQLAALAEDLNRAVATGQREGISIPDVLIRAPC
jgi:arylsulfatase A-like enzyme